jgi:peptide/nickel transport system permease protein
MSALMQEPATGMEPVTGASRRGDFFWKLLKDRKAAAIGLGVLVFFVLLSVIGPYVAPYSSTAQSCAVFAAPSVHHWLGCDDGGIDMLSELIQGGRISLIVGFAATLVAMVIGGGVGILSGYFGGWTDITLMRITDYLLVIPDLVFAMVIADIWGPSLFHVIMVIAILEWTGTARVIRAQVMTVKERVYIKRARATGASHARILWKHILPQMGPLLIANTVLTVAIAIYLETALAFLNLEDPTATTWGTILEHAFERSAVASGAWWAIVPDGICIALVCVGCFLLGQAIEDALNPRLKIAHLSLTRWKIRTLAGRGTDAI